MLHRDQAQALIQAARREQRTLMTEWESKQLLAAYGIPVVETRVTRTPDEAVAAADAIGYPVVVKLYSHTITHKTDVGGVQLNLPDAAVRQAYRVIAQAVETKAGAAHFEGVTVQPMIQWTGYELIIGSNMDAQFGPVLLFGLGGQLVEVFRDRALALPPLTSTLARRMIAQTRIYQALRGVRGRKPVDLTALEQLLVNFSQLVAEQRWIKEIDINPLLASSEQLIALDARVVLHDPDLPESALPPLAIRPYPRQYVQPWTTRDGLPLTLRPIRPEDEPMLVRFHEQLSERSTYLRYMQPLTLSERTTHVHLVRVCFSDYDRQLVLVAEAQDAGTGERRLVAVGRLIKAHGGNEAEVTLTVIDAFQHRGLGTELLRRLVAIGRDERLDRISAEILAENTGMQEACANAGFRLMPTAEGRVRAELDLGAGS